MARDDTPNASTPILPKTSDGYVPVPTTPYPPSADAAASINSGHTPYGEPLVFDDDVVADGPQCRAHPMVPGPFRCAACGVNLCQMCIVPSPNSMRSFVYCKKCGSAEAETARQAEADAKRRRDEQDEQVELCLSCLCCCCMVLFTGCLKAR